MNASTWTARVVVDELVRSGVREIVLAPGSRSAPLAFAAHEADATGRLRLHVRADERSAGFLALGLAKAARQPVAVVTTSGTAAANLHPAVLEASHAGVALVVLTADRPALLRGTGANQTTDQVHLFARSPRYFADLAPGPADPALRSTIDRAVAAATGALSADPGPVHLNLQFDDPLVPEPAGSAPPPASPDDAAWTRVAAPAAQVEPVVLPPGPRTVVIAGDDAGPEARRLAERAGWPLLAEPTSGARTGATAVRTYRLLLGDPAWADRIERVVVFGHPTLSRPVSRLLGRRDLEIVVVTSRAAWPDAGHAARLVTPAVTVAEPAGGGTDPDWAAAWHQADSHLAKAVDDLLAAEPATTPHEVAAAVWVAVPTGGLLVVGSSNPVRDLDLMATGQSGGEHRRVLANRGLAGIDGTVSTAVGAALARPSPRALALMGDLTFLHDANGLLLGPDDPRPDLTIVVVNDDGGGIFALLEQGAPEYAGAFERIFGTPHGADLGALCAATHTPHRRLDDLDELRSALERPPRGVEVIEVPVDRTGRRELDQRLRALRVP